MTTAQSSPAPVRRGRPRLADRDGDVRETAIAAARQVCAEVSEGGFTMERVARALGMRTPSLYHHFPGGREELILAVADYCSAQDGTAIARIVAEGHDPLACFHLIARHFASAIDQHPYRQLTELRERLSSATRGQIQSRFSERVEQPLIDLVGRGIAQGQFRGIDPELFVRAFLTLMLNMNVFEIAGEKRGSLPDLLVDLLVDGASPASP